MPPSPTWLAFLKGHIGEDVAVDFFVVPTVQNQVLFVFLLLAHDRRHVLHFNITCQRAAGSLRLGSLESRDWPERASCPRVKNQLFYPHV